jgi:hypothetical protein
MNFPLRKDGAGGAEKLIGGLARQGRWVEEHVA